MCEIIFFKYKNLIEDPKQCDFKKGGSISWKSENRELEQ
jgi:hypothetical protein